MRSFLIGCAIGIILYCSFVILASLALSASPEPPAAPTNLWHQQATGARHSTNMGNVTLERLVGLLNPSNSVCLTLRDGLVHVRIANYPN